MNHQNLYRLPVVDTISTAWGKVYGAKAEIFKALAAVFCISILFSVIDTGIKHFSIPLGFIVSLITTFIQFLLQMGVMYIGIMRALELPISYKLITRSLDAKIALSLIGFYLISLVAFLPIFITLFLSGSMTNVGTAGADHSISMFAVLLNLIGIIITLCIYVRISLGQAFILDKTAGPVEAFKLSYQATRDNTLTLMGYYILIFLITIISAIPLGIGLIWTLPLAIIGYGVAYKRLLANVK